VPDDLVVMATDGIRSDFGSRVPAGATPDAVADLILGCCARDTDDALVLAFRLQGSGR
jgi:hypothetical protein